MARSCRRCCISALTSASGTSSSTSSASASPTFSRSDIWACILRTARHAVGEVVAQLVDGLELGGLGGPLVVELGQHPLLDLLDGDPEVQRRSSSGSGWSASNSRIVAGRGAGELLVELGHDAAAADLVEVVLGGEALERLAVLGAGDVDGDVVALGRRPLDGGELGELAAQAVDLVVDLLVGGHRAPGS